MGKVSHLMCVFYFNFSTYFKNYLCGGETSTNRKKFIIKKMICTHPPTEDN
jgi:hypothetical protein